MGLPKVEVLMSNVDIESEEITSILSNIENSIPDRIFLIDHNTWTIFMVNKDGTVLDKKGGVGRGPGEFLLINDMHIYVEENILQVFNKKSQRLTYYNVREDSLELDHVVQLPDYGQNYLQTVFKSYGNTYGVFRVLQQYENMEIENKLYVYYLDEELNKKEKILEIEGTELLEVEGFNGEKRFIENIFGNETVWSFDNDKLFYSNAENLNFKVFNFDDKNIIEYEIPNIPENINTSQTSEALVKKYSLMFNIHPEYEAFFKQRKNLPYFNDIYASEKYLYFPLVNYGNEKAYILRYNLSTSKMGRVETPSNFYMKGVNQTGIYGTLANNDPYGVPMISVLEFEESE